MKLHVLRAALPALLAMAIGVAPATATQAAPTTPSLEQEISTASAAAAGLWNCSPMRDSYTYSCTTIKNAPTSGVKVRDRVDGVTKTLYNGNSVVLSVWYTDTSGKCGVQGNQYVWIIKWWDNYERYAYIGDYYLNTGSVSNWWGFSDTWGTLGSRNSGQGTGYCNEFPL